MAEIVKHSVWRNSSADYKWHAQSIHSVTPVLHVDAARRLHSHADAALSKQERSVSLRASAAAQALPEQLHKFGPPCISTYALDFHSHTPVQSLFSAAAAGDMYSSEHHSNI